MQCAGVRGRACVCACARVCAWRLCVCACVRACACERVCERVGAFLQISIAMTPLLLHLPSVKTLQSYGPTATLATLRHDAAINTEEPGGPRFRTPS